MAEAAGSLSIHMVQEMLIDLFGFQKIDLLLRTSVTGKQIVKHHRLEFKN